MTTIANKLKRLGADSMWNSNGIEVQSPMKKAYKKGNTLFGMAGWQVCMAHFIKLKLKPEQKTECLQNMCEFVEKMHAMGTDIKSNGMTALSVDSQKNTLFQVNIDAKTGKATYTNRKIVGSYKAIGSGGLYAEEKLHEGEEIAEAIRHAASKDPNTNEVIIMAHEQQDLSAKFEGTTNGDVLLATLESDVLAKASGSEMPVGTMIYAPTCLLSADELAEMEEVEL
ncbi:hypothetical protein ACYTR9_13250 [Vibrio antiquarius]